MISTDTVQIEIKKTKRSRLSEIDQKNLGFGKYFSDHIFIAEFTKGQWGKFRIIPYRNIEMSPAMSAIHYGQAIFEGMKAYRWENGDVYLSRPLDNFRRMNLSSERIAMPLLPEEMFIGGMIELLRLDKNWVPSAPGYSLYVRPVYFATEEHIGVKISDDYMFIILTCPVGTYYSQPLKVLVETKYTRAVPGGVGYTKTAGNYGRSHLPTKLAYQKGYQQVLWTDGYTHKYIEESGTMNVMFVIDDTLITPELHDTILAGITRESVLTIARDWEMKVEERKISVDELLDAHKKGTLQEIFGVGTAATIAPIYLFGYQDKDYELPPVSKKDFGSRFKKELDNIRYGKTADKYGWMYKV